jgi:hypothetical protein
MCACRVSLGHGPWAIVRDSAHVGVFPEMQRSEGVVAVTCAAAGVLDGACGRQSALRPEQTPALSHHTSFCVGIMFALAGSILRGGTH